ncbi:MAG: chitobiase/beta-hexosaminidase C-terminal domain-containing protein, partial [Clostridia bacterium]|nr:chitobiase/beta-hexosaminidase C-terminal domain-containing protein [Clostridia bacterium]
EVLTATYTITGTVATPVASPSAGTYTTAQTVTLSTTTEGATIYYTTDGTTPTANSTRYTAAISVAENTVIKAIAIMDHWTASDVLEASYTINYPVTKVEVSPDTMTMKPGESRKITIRITPENATDKALTVSMDQEGIVTIAEDGTITALKNGTVKVTFTAGNGVTGSCVITVKADPIQYKIIQGTDQTVFTNADRAVFASDADFSKFDHVEVDGKTVAKKYYTAESGSTVITFNKEFIKTLSVGKHTMTIVSKDGSAKTSFNVADPHPKTGDSSTPFLWLGMCMLAIFSVLTLRKKAYKN